MAAEDIICMRCRRTVIDVGYVPDSAVVWMQTVRRDCKEVEFALCSDCVEAFAEFLIPTLKDDPKYIAEMDQYKARIRDWKDKQ